MKANLAPVVGKALDPRWKSRLRLKTPMIVKVTWMDACYRDGGFDLNDSWTDRYQSGVVQQSIGYKLKQDANFITIGMDLNLQCGSIRHVMDLPMCNILEVKELK